MKKFLFLLFLLLVSAGCRKKGKSNIPEINIEKEHITKSLYQLSIDSIKRLYDKSVEDKNLVKQMLFSIEMGKRMRNISRYSEAMLYHKNGLNIALDLKDTITAAQAWNHLGTNCRRISALSEASYYHYQALTILDSYSKKESFQAIKTRASAWNGIGNINLELGYYEEAEKNIQEALQIEKKLNNYRGQAINYANLGHIFLKRKEYDKARAYFLLSMEQNTQNNSLMGIALCNINLGTVYEEEGNYPKALEKYTSANKLIEQLSDQWLRLNVYIPLARIHLKLENERAYNHYISMAEKTAKGINSISHLIQIYDLQHTNYEKKKEYKQALEAYRQSKSLTDSISKSHKIGNIKDTRFYYEHNKSQKVLETIKQKNKAQQERSSFILYTFIIVLSLLIIFSLLTYIYKKIKEQRAKNKNKNLPFRISVRFSKGEEYAMNRTKHPTYLKISQSNLMKDPYSETLISYL